jgi:hypothetical protein
MSSQRKIAGWLLGIALLAGGCQASRNEPSSAGAPAEPAAQRAAAPNAASPRSVKAADGVPSERRIARKAALTLQVGSPSDAQRTASRIVEAHGGYVASSDRSTEAGSRGASSATLVLRVPAAKFSAVLSELRRLGQGAGTEQVSSEDVTEEFIDLEARIKNQRALEERFLAILRTATKVEEALQVEREVAAVRTEIDRMEGRRRFLERETELSTITLTFAALEPLVRSSFADFGRAFERAYGDAFNVGAGIVTASIRLAGVLAPVLVLFGLPALLVLRVLLKRHRKAAPLA